MINKGVHILNSNNKAEKTIVVVGIARSGTTMTARVLHALGVDMGVVNNDVVCERFDITDQLENGKTKEFEETIKNENKLNKVWGWKRPRAFEYKDLFENKIRNPHYIVPFRDYAAIASRNSINLDFNFTKNLILTHRKRYNLLIDFIEKNDKPILIFSYEKAMMNRKNFVRKVAEFVGINDEEKIENAFSEIKPNVNKYTKNCDKPNNKLIHIKNGRIFGFAKIGSSNIQCKVKLYVDDELFKTVIAKRAVKKNPKKGPHYFNESFEELGLEKGKSYKISAHDHNDVPLKNSPLTYVHE